MDRRQRPSSRRVFLRQVGGLGAAISLGYVSGGLFELEQAAAQDQEKAKEKGKKAPGKVPAKKEQNPSGPTKEDLVDPEKSKVAKSLQYNHDASEAAARNTAKMGVEPKNQICGNCQFYTKTGSVNGEEVGRCSLIPEGLVKRKGWCLSWAKKA